MASLLTKFRYAKEFNECKYCFPLPPFLIYLIQTWYGPYGVVSPQSHGGSGGTTSTIILPAGVHIVGIKVCNFYYEQDKVNYAVSERENFEE